MSQDEAIAQAAREFVAARTENMVMRTEQTASAERQAYAKLAWMVEAPRQGWDHNNYEPEE